MIRTQLTWEKTAQEEGTGGKYVKNLVRISIADQEGDLIVELVKGFRQWMLAKGYNET